MVYRAKRRLTVNNILHFANPTALYFIVPIFVIALVLRYKYVQSPVYNYPLADVLSTHKITTRHPFKKILAFMRFLLLALLVFLIAKPQLVDTGSKVHVEGIDIVLALDVSGSMQMQDGDDRRSRVDIAKHEAIRFIEKRDNDAIGLVIFGKDAVSRCPLTLDKTVLKNIVRDLAIGIVDPDGTVLSKALLTAINRLKNSTAKSKIIILLTDGEPSPEDIQPKLAIEAAKKLGIKVYTVGIGSDKEVGIMHPIYGLIAAPKLNDKLLKLIADQTGGKFFMARNAQDMRAIYDTIDTLERTTIETPIFSNYVDIFVPFVCVCLGLCLLEAWLTSLLWFSL